MLIFADIQSGHIAILKYTGYVTNNDLLQNCITFLGHKFRGLNARINTTKWTFHYMCL